MSNTTRNDAILIDVPSLRERTKHIVMVTEAYNDAITPALNAYRESVKAAEKRHEQRVSESLDKKALEIRHAHKEYAEATEKFMDAYQNAIAMIELEHPIYLTDGSVAKLV